MTSFLDIRNALGAATVYRRFQHFVSGNHYARFVDDYLRPEAGQRILDIGCGPAAILEYLPDVEYVGVDISPKYIDFARRRYGNRGQFHCRRVCETSLNEWGTFDLVIAHGIVHHLDDNEASHLFQLAITALNHPGRLVTLDGCFVEGQSRVARQLLVWDRGQHVRNEHSYRQLAQAFFPDIAVDVRSDLIRLPYTHIIMQCYASSAIAERATTRAHAA
ncbi:MAG: class I SAM-dependent methyltransferase [Pirellulales bacterium]